MKPTTIFKSTFFFLFSFFLLNCNSLFAETKTWTAATDSNWAVGSNWEPTGTPTATDEVVIPNLTPPTIEDGTTVSIKSLVVQFNASLSIENNAILNIDGSANTGFFNAGTISNSGQINIGASGAIGHSGIVNHKTFTNEIGGEINIDQIGGHGIYSNSGAQFTNKGTIHIGANKTISLDGIHNRGNFTNESEGEITSDRAKHGINNYAFQAVFTNKGKITIGAIAQVHANGYYNNAGRVNNSGEGEINIVDARWAGIANQWSFFASAKFVNHACATIRTSVRIHNTRDFENYGFIFSNYCDNHFTGKDGGYYPHNPYFLNKGTIEDLHNSFGEFTFPLNNKGLIISPTCGGAAVFSDILTIDNNNHFTVSTDWYSDSALTMDAGDYDSDTNTFTASNPVETATFYMEVTDDNNPTCKEVMAINIGIKTAITSNGPTICLGEDLELGENLDCSTFTRNTAWQWSGPNGFTSNLQNPTIPNASAAATGTYTLTVTNAVSCTATTSISIEASSPYLASSGLEGTSGTGQITYMAEVCSGTAPYTANFVSTGGFATLNELPSENASCLNYQIIYSNPTDWTLTISDASGCTVPSLSSDDILSISSYAVTPETCVGDEDGTITIEVEGGDDNCDEYTYNWSGPSGFSETNTDMVTGNTIEDLASGTYNVTVTDCDGTTTVQTGIYVSRANVGGRSGRGRSGGCKTGGNEAFDEINQMNVYPNPFAERTLVEFSLPVTSNVWLSVYSIDGRKVASILEGERLEGEILQRYDFDASNLDSGMYLLELQTEFGLRQHQQLAIVK